MQIGHEPDAPWVTSRGPRQAHLDGFEMAADGFDGDVAGAAVTGSGVAPRSFARVARGSVATTTACGGNRSAGALGAHGGPPADTMSSTCGATATAITVSSTLPSAAA